MNIDSDVILDFRNRLEVTQQCRFNYSERLRKTGSALQSTIVFYSLIATFISIITLTNLIKESLVLTILNSVSLFLAVVTATVSSVLTGGKFFDRSAKLVNCGNSIGNLINTIESFKQSNKYILSKNEYDQLSKSYENTLNESENHQTIDKHLTDLNKYRRSVREHLSQYSINKEFLNKSLTFKILMFLKSYVNVFLDRQPYLFLSNITGFGIIIYTIIRIVEIL